MNYQTFSNLQLRPLLRKCFHRIQTEMRSSSGATFVCICPYYTTCFNGWESLQHSFLTNRRYKIFALIQAEIPFCNGFGRHRGRGFGALALVIAETTN